MVFINPRGENVSVDLRGEFTLTCGGEEDVFFPDEEGFEELCEEIRELLGE